MTSPINRMTEQQAVEESKKRKIARACIDAVLRNIDEILTYGEIRERERLALTAASNVIRVALKLVTKR